jgi:adenylate kinase
MLKNPDNQTIIILLGPPGSGKGTQAKLLEKECHLPHISTGDLFREQMTANTPIGQKAKEFIQAGHLVPDEVVLGMLFERIAQIDCARGYILDGVPRTVFQANQLAHHQTKGRVLVFSLEVPDEVIIKRAVSRLVCRQCSTIYNLGFSQPIQPGICDKCGGEVYRRQDDEESVVRKRLNVYRKQTEPLIQYYDHLGLLKVFDGNKPSNVLNAELKQNIPTQV